MPDTALPDKSVQNGFLNETDLFGSPVTVHKCVFCGKDLPKDSRPNRKYCDNICRIGAFRAKEDRQRGEKADRRRRKFEEFHAANPHILDRMLAVVNKARQAQHRPGMKAICEWIRYGMDDDGGRGIQINNSFVALYADKIEEKIGEAFFEHRRGK